MKLLVWGTGKISDEFINKIDDDFEVVAFVDSYKVVDMHQGIKVITPKDIINYEYDWIVVANSFSTEIYNIICDVKINMDKVIFLRKFGDIWFNINKNKIDDNERKIKKMFYKYYKSYPVLSRNNKVYTQYSNYDCLNDVLESKDEEFLSDYFRYRTFEFIADELDNVDGDLAEVGVFRGDFAKIIHDKFPNRKLYLFDTFEGFGQEEENDVIESGIVSEKWTKEFKNTSVDYVYKKLNCSENVIIKQGLFPQSLDGLESKFAFVSLDVDFEKSTYECLKYFYPRLSDGGYIFIHDYNHGYLRGVKEALDRFEKEYGRIIRIPIADEGGTVIVSK